VLEDRCSVQVFGPKKNEASEEFEVLRNAKFRDIYTTPSSIRIEQSG
jgi:hypothetical protein